jgi:hypothetical protein
VYIDIDLIFVRKSLSFSLYVSSMILDLSCIENEFFGLILLDPTSDFIIMNQCGGTTCAQPMVNGLYVPLPTNWRPNVDPLLDYWEDDYDPELVAKYLNGMNGISDIFEPMTDFLACYEIMKEKKFSWGEAWIPITIVSNNFDILKGANNKQAILTYDNSD